LTVVANDLVLLWAEAMRISVKVTLLIKRRQLGDENAS
jgi:hypothetical protein